MSQGLTILLDSFRLLKAKKLFWLSMAITIMVALLYASIGFNDEGITFFFGAKAFANPLIRAGTDEAAAFYLLLFTDVVVKFWLAWFSIVLALITTASLFPDFVSEGSIGLSLSKPIGRFRLFLWKYLGGLLFVFVQVGLFALIVFLAIGFRLDEWSWSVFWAVPIITFVFSLLFSVCTLIGVKSGSTLLALLGGFLIWGASLLVQWGEGLAYQVAYTMPEMGMSVDMTTGELQEGAESSGDEVLVMTHTWLSRIAYPLPKTRDCTLGLKRLIRFEERDSFLSGLSLDMILASIDDAEVPAMRPSVKKYDERHSVAYIYGSSLIFELVMIGLAGWIFCRRDY